MVGLARGPAVPGIFDIEGSVEWFLAVFLGDFHID